MVAPRPCADLRSHYTAAKDPRGLAPRVNKALPTVLRPLFFSVPARSVGTAALVIFSNVRLMESANMLYGKVKGSIPDARTAINIESTGEVGGSKWRMVQDYNY